jgi:hypothetical protein
MSGCQARRMGSGSSSSFQRSTSSAPRPAGRELAMTRVRTGQMSRILVPHSSLKRKETLERASDLRFCWWAILGLNQ